MEIIEINSANSYEFARKFVDENLEILKTTLSRSGIEIDLKKNDLNKYTDKSLFEKSTIEAISEFYLSKLNEVNEHEMVTLENIFSAYIVEMFSVKLKGHVDYIPVELSSEYRLAANTGLNESGQGAGIIYADETIEKIRKKNKASFLSILLKGQMAKRKFME